MTGFLGGGLGGVESGIENLLTSSAGEPLDEGLIFGIQANKVAVNAIDEGYSELLEQAQELYPNKAGIIELHHIIPKYLGGAIDGELAPIDAAYHQVITNAFRSAWPYGIGKPSLIQLQEILENVYTKFPLP